MRQGPNERLMALMTEARCSNKGLARRLTDIAATRNLRGVRVDHNDVRKWRAGTLPQEPKPAMIADVLTEQLGRRITLADIGMESSSARDIALDFLPSVEGLVAVADRLWTRDSEGISDADKDTVSAAALTTPIYRWMTATPLKLRDGPSSRQFALGDMSALTHMADMFTSAVNRYGGGHIRASAVEFLRRDIAPLLRMSHTESVGRQLFTTAGHMAFLVGDMSYDVAHHALARRYFALSLNLAHASGDRVLGARVLVRMSHQATFLGEYREAAELARAARVGAAACLPNRAMAAIAAMEARAMSAARDAVGCDRALLDADTAWFRYFDEAELVDEFGHCFRDLGRSEHAAEYAEQAIATSTPDYPRSRVFTRFVLAAALLQSGDEERACTEALLALHDIERIRSERVRVYLADFCAQLQRRATRPASDFLEQANLLLAAHQ